VISDFVRSYLPLGNPVGFGASDTLIFTLAALLVALVLARTYLERPARWLAQRSIWCLLLLAVLPVILRLALLRTHPVPTPDTADDFSYLLLSDTLAHWRLANPVHPMHRFFEAVFVLQEPSYSSIFSPGQGIVLALGQIVFGSPWAGVVLSMAALSASIYWMLRAWTTPMWALIGGLLGVFEFGPLSPWMNSYWGGAVAASAGCLVFGSLPRLQARWRNRDAALLGAGLGVHMLTRPFESVFLALCVVLYCVPVVINGIEWPRMGKAATIALLAAVPAIALTLFHDHAVTGSWTTLPYSVSRYQYGVPTTFTVHPNPEPHRVLTHEQSIDYQAQRLVHGEGTDTVRSYFERLISRFRFYRFFFFAPLYLVLPFFLVSVREFRFLWVLLSVIVFTLGTNFYPYFQPHYIASLTSVFLLVSVTALERVSRWSKDVSRTILLLCAAQFLFWYGVHLSSSPKLLSALSPYETWDYINYGDLDGRAAINQRLAQAPGNQLVFVRYWPSHLFDEWIHNAADPDASRVIFAGDLGPGENEKLRQYYPDRTPWILEPDARPPRLTPYSSSYSSPFSSGPAVEFVTPGPTQPLPVWKGKRPGPIVLETVH
jgi:hypothetical protein